MSRENQRKYFQGKGTILYHYVLAPWREQLHFSTCWACVCMYVWGGSKARQRLRLAFKKTDNDSDKMI
jgi:hypothetical protein